MTKNIYYLHIVNGIVAGFHSYKVDKKNVPENEKFIEVETTNPTNYIGLDEKEIFLDPLPPVIRDTVDKTTKLYLRSELKKLFYEIQFTKAIDEDVKELEVLYETKLREYRENTNG
ncbi:MAG: hypothetical protein ACOVOQ_14045 [Flavobacterium sp.]